MKPEDWLTKPIFFSMMFITMAALYSSCSQQVATIKYAPDSHKQLVQQALSQVPLRTEGGEIFLICKEYDGEEFMTCHKIFVDFRNKSILERLKGLFSLS